MINIFNDFDNNVSYDISLYNGNSEKYFDNGEEYSLIEIREWKDDNCQNVYHKYTMNHVKSTAVFYNLLKEKDYIELLIQQPKIVDIKQLAKKYLEEVLL